MNLFHEMFQIFMTINLFSPWYSWKIAVLALNNNHTLIIYEKKDMEFL
jgi:hypothetical protein